MAQIISFCNQKGGVGKTTSTVNLGTILAGYGYSVLLLDMDSQGNATSGVGEEKPDIESTTYQLFVDNSDYNKLIKNTAIKNMDIIRSNADLSACDIELVNLERREYRLKEQLNRLSRTYDFILIDCPPSLGLVTINCLVASRYIIIPLQCEYYALEGLGQLINTYQLVHNNLNQELEIGGVILTMADLRTNLTQQVIEEVRSYFKEKVFKAVIPRSVKLSEAPSFGKPAVLYDSHNKASMAYYEVAREFALRFSDKDFVPKNPKVENDPQESIQQKEEEIPQPSTVESSPNQENQVHNGEAEHEKSIG